METIFNILNSFIELVFAGFFWVFIGIIISESLAKKRNQD